MSKATQTTTDVLNSLTGHDEMSITQHFGRTISDLLNNDPTMYGRALVFVLKRRENVNDDDARNAALGMTLEAVSDHFVQESDAAADESEPGKDEPESEQPALSPSQTSLSSVS